MRYTNLFVALLTVCFVGCASAPEPKETDTSPPDVQVYNFSYEAQTKGHTCVILWQFDLSNRTDEVKTARPILKASGTYNGERQVTEEKLQSVVVPPRKGFRYRGATHVKNCRRGSIEEVSIPRVLVEDVE